MDREQLINLLQSIDFIKNEVDKQIQRSNDLIKAESNKELSKKFVINICHISFHSSTFNVVHILFTSVVISLLLALVNIEC